MRQFSSAVLGAAALLGTTLAAAGSASAGERGLFTSGAWGSPCCVTVVPTYSYQPHVTYSESTEVIPHYRTVIHPKLIHHQHTVVHQHLHVHRRNIIDREIVQHRVRYHHKYSTRHVHQYRTKTEVNRSRQIEHRGKPGGCCD